MEIYCSFILNVEKFKADFFNRDWWPIPSCCYGLCCDKIKYFCIEIKDLNYF